MKRFQALFIVLLAIWIPSCNNITDSKPRELLVISPSIVEIDEFFPGTIAKQLQMNNQGNEPIDDIRISASCGCLDVTPKSIAKPLAPKESIPITVTISNDGSSPTIDQTITIEGNMGNKRVVKTISIKGKNISTILNLNSNGELDLGDIVRKSPGYASKSFNIPCSVHPSITSMSIEPTVPWLVLKQKFSGGFRATAVCTSSAPEGKFTSMARIRFRTAGTSSGEEYVLLKGNIKSEIKTNPSSISFGVVKVRQRIAASAKLTIRIGLPKSLSITVSDRSLLASMKRISATEAIVSVVFLPRSEENFEESISLVSEGRILTVIPISAYCTH